MRFIHGKQAQPLGGFTATSILETMKIKALFLQRKKAFDEAVFQKEEKYLKFPSEKRVKNTHI